MYVRVYQAVRVFPMRMLKQSRAPQREFCEDEALLLVGWQPQTSHELLFSSPFLSTHYAHNLTIARYIYVYPLKTSVRRARLTSKSNKRAYCQQGRKSMARPPRTSRRNSRRWTSRPPRRSTATRLALLIQTTFNSCSTQSQMSLSPIICVAAVSIRINIPVAEPIDRHTLTTLTHVNTTDIYCENEGACENERVRDWRASVRERGSDRAGEKASKKVREERMREVCTYVPPLLLPTTCGYLLDFFFIKYPLLATPFDFFPVPTMPDWERLTRWPVD